MSSNAIVVPSGRRVFTEIDPSAFQHPLDRQATEQLRKIQYFDRVVEKFIEYGFERLEYVFNIASNIQVTPRQLPKLYGMLREGCAILDVPEPELYVAQGGINAFTSGHTKPYIVLYTGLIDIMTDDELMGVLSHELGHIKCRHVLYKVMARQLGVLTEIAAQATFGLGGLVGMPLQMALTLWDRRAELSADRAALLVLQDPHPCVTMLMKLAGGTSRLAAELSPVEFLEQARNYKDISERARSDKIYKFMASLYQGTHPWTIERAHALNDWIDSPDYEQIVHQGIYTRVAKGVVNGLCPRGHPADPTYRFCAICGLPLKS